eukprot:CAMPEP_0113315708 /NCGR_PEP_ID=MMETSP0010_2-20120614/11270_1 /TAXON_ID=216773 ORGANISM="Corethron hystrix, Strain 308" /NCGR_SAMPLE_ID=MMETSP0010_2 /ASSEMBLY_ACC=CAM_ASM_000155 /LENGTH=222 /DNA_ID=CAMNT_0000172267 /DNA_START=111 /DNA_END=779 /DNA_ORIENTATION=- /assembly_acc=CAM_ASM_000155
MASFTLSHVILLSVAPVVHSFTPIHQTSSGPPAVRFLRKTSRRRARVPWHFGSLQTEETAAVAEDILCDEQACIDLVEAAACADDEVNCSLEEMQVMQEVLEHTRDDAFLEGGRGDLGDQELLERMLLEEDLEEKLEKKATILSEVDPLCDEEQCIDLNEAAHCADGSTDCSVEDMKDYVDVLQHVRDEEFLEGGSRGDDDQKLMERMLLEDDLEEKMAGKM